MNFSINDGAHISPFETNSSISGGMNTSISPMEINRVSTSGGIINNTYMSPSEMDRISTSGMERVSKSGGVIYFKK
jgi:hypothetical protein